MIAVDTNVLIYACDRAEPRRFSRREVNNLNAVYAAPFRPHTHVYSDGECRRSEPAFCGSEGTCQGSPHCRSALRGLDTRLALPRTPATIGASAE